MINLHKKLKKNEYFILQTVLAQNNMFVYFCANGCHENTPFLFRVAVLEKKSYHFDKSMDLSSEINLEQVLKKLEDDIN